MTRLVLDGGAVLKGRYVIDELMGMGGFANAYKAWDPLLDCMVAIKEYREYIPDFLEEARITAQFRSSPNIIYVYDFFEENGAAYIVMEFLKGCTLKEHLEKNGKVRQREAIAITLAVLGALRTVHENGMVHRDVAPDNVFLLSDGKVKLFDFGSAGKIGEKPKSVVVKKGYSPLEQYDPDVPLDPSADVYAAAALLVRMLSGKKILPATERRKKDTVQRLIRGCAGNRRKLQKALKEALRMDASVRIKTVFEFEERLREAEKEKKCGPGIAAVLIILTVTAVLIRWKNGSMANGKANETANETATVVKANETVEETTEAVTVLTKESKPQTEKTEEHGTARKPETTPEPEKTPEPEEPPEPVTVMEAEMSREFKAPQEPETAGIPILEPTIPDPDGW